MATPAGFEPAAPCLEGRCSIQLSYGVLIFPIFLVEDVKMGCMKKASGKQARRLPFYKLHGAGNDIVVFLSRHLPLSLQAKARFLRQMAHRQLGVGCDQFVEVLSLPTKTKPLSLQIWNADGSRPEICANGVRSLLFLAARKKWISPSAKSIAFHVAHKPYTALRSSRGGYEVCLGTPLLEGQRRIEVLGREVPFWQVNVGNPHAVVLEKGDLPLLTFGPAMEKHSHFPHKTNVEFVRSWRKEGKKVYAEVEAWERGAGATLSCGSGAVAVAAVLREQTGLDQVEVKMTDFLLQIRFEGGKAHLSGPCALVCEGSYFS